VNKTTTVSVLIPCFNAERWIGVAIASALEQTHEHVEVIVVDDGSTDNSRTVIESFSNRITCEFNSNVGGNATRNRLLTLASGHWLQFLDADDYVLPEKISRQLASACERNSDIDVIYSPVMSEVWRDSEVHEHSIGFVDNTASLEEQWIRWQVAQTGSVLWRREALVSIGGWNEEYPCCQDNEVTLRAIQNGLKFHYCPDVGAVYRIWSEETVCRKDPARVICYKTRLIDQMLAWLAEQGKVTPATEAAAGQAFFEMARTWAKYDLAKATEYQQIRRRKGWYRPAGPAAPLSYRLTHGLLGFQRAEQIAAWRR
jgi:glycosyltransferase involved in cell wall biosynthesis